MCRNEIEKERNRLCGKTDLCWSRCDPKRSDNIPSRAKDSLQYVTLTAYARDLAAAKQSAAESDRHDHNSTAYWSALCVVLYCTCQDSAGILEDVASSCSLAVSIPVPTVRLGDRRCAAD